MCGTCDFFTFEAARDLVTSCQATEKHLWKPDELSLSTSTYLIPFQERQNLLNKAVELLNLLEAVCRRLNLASPAV